MICPYNSAQMRAVLCLTFRCGAVLAAMTLPIAGSVPAAKAASVVLQWDSNRERDVAGYVVVYGTSSGQLTSAVNVGNHTSYQVTDLDSGRTYFFAVKAYNTAGALSAPSAEVSTTTSSSSFSLTNLMSSVTPPRPAGTSVVFAAGATGGTPPYQYKWFVFDGSTWTMVKDWSAENTFTWKPLSGNVNYVIKAWARSANAGTAGSDVAERIMPFAITSMEAIDVNVVADKQAPQSAGTPVVFTASASGASGSYQFEWSVFDGVSWKVLQNWSSNAAFSWTPAAANASYKVKVQVRAGTSLTGNTALTLPFAIE